MDKMIYPSVISEDIELYLRLVGDEEAHVPPEVGVLDLGGGRSDDLTSHFEAKKKETSHFWITHF